MQTFRDYMEKSLYDPQDGYYYRRIPKEDFYTAPELHPAFAGILTRELLRRLESLKERGVPGPYSIIEMGSGPGLLAQQILKELRLRHPDWAQSLRYILVERSKDVLLESVLSLSASYGRVLGYTRLEDVLPCSGIFFSNELVDAFPVHLLEKREGRVYEVYVEESGRILLSELSSPELGPYAEAVGGELAEGERHAVNLEALSWLRTAAEKIKNGYLITVDYGKRFANSPNPPRAFFRHATDDRLTEARGLKDITASVDFEVLIIEGKRLGLRLETYAPLGRFLLDGGIADWMNEASHPSKSEAESFKARAKMKTLLHPEGMGDAYKVLVQGKFEDRPSEQEMPQQRAQAGGEGPWEGRRPS